METYKEKFIEFMVRSGVLAFGDFTTKSGRKTPYFINTGKYETGEQIYLLGRFYADTIRRFFSLYGGKRVLFGPAYKGIPLVVAAAIAINEICKASLPFCFNRKETKDHGEGGSLIGHKLQDGEKIIVIEDVITAGTSIRETFALFAKEAPGAIIDGVFISVDRMEKGTGEISAVQEIREEFDIDVYPIVTIDEIISHLYQREIGGKVIIDEEAKSRIDAYREQYGIKR